MPSPDPPGGDPADTADQPQAPDLLFSDHEHIAEVVSDPNVSTVIFEIGFAGALGHDRAIRAGNSLLELLRVLRPSQAIAMSIGGYDNDPRSLYEIPLVRRFVCRVMQEAGILNFQHPAVRCFSEDSIVLLTLCGAFGTDHPFKVKIANQTPARLNRLERW